MQFQIKIRRALVCKRKMYGNSSGGRAGTSYGNKNTKTIFRNYRQTGAMLFFEVFQESEIIDEIILVVGKGQETYCKRKLLRNIRFKR